VYLDKPMRNHTLMQTIARANRVYPGKHSGTIVDYANVFASLEKAPPSMARRGGNSLQDARRSRSCAGGEPPLSSARRAKWTWPPSNTSPPAGWRDCRRSTKRSTR
jgi:hypothetical protein